MAIVDKVRADPVLAAAKHWVRRGLMGQLGVLSDDRTWSDENIAAFNQHFVEKLDWGEGDFLAKLERQLAPASPGVKKLAAEMLWVMQLCPSNVKPPAKRTLISTVWEFSGEPAPLNSQWLADDVLAGIGSAGTAFNTNRWRELVFFTRILQQFRALSTDRQEELINDGWAFGEWVGDLEEGNTRQLRAMLLFLLFPVEFERIFGGTDRRAIVAAFKEMPLGDVKRLSAFEIDQALYDIRQEQERNHPGANLDFYEEPLRHVWKNASGPEAMRSISREHVLSALEQIRTDGVPSDAQSTFYDLLEDGRRYPPKYVLSLAGEFANGVKMDRGLFSGGESSQAFRHLRKLGFEIVSKNALSELVQEFVDQANEGVDLGTSNYLRSYGGLDVSVSFGKGNFAKIPWVAFTGFGQTVQGGIYPVLLYYKSEGLLVVACGLSETHPPDRSWPDRIARRTIAEALQEDFSVSPARYGASFVKSVYQADSLNPTEIGADLEELIALYKETMGNVQEVRDEAIQPEPYSVDDALNELFIDSEKIESTIELIRRKKNVILQGPPGVGKTFVCKRLAFALMGEKAEDRLTVIQFHQAYAYEDFIQGYRPSGTGFTLKDGVFFQFCNLAGQDLSRDYVFVIDEINRGNLSKIFGELMMLIESDKRGPDWAIPLAYGDGPEDKFFVPENVYIIGLMNTADRSLAVVDYALRRRFGFVDLQPGFSTEQFYSYLIDHGAKPDFVDVLVEKLSAVNRRITEDTANLGPGFCIGHSFFSTLSVDEVPDESWYERIIETEVGPLLREYWFDNPDQAEQLIRELHIS